MFICALVVSFAALALRARAANDTTRAQINNIPSKSHVIPLLTNNHKSSILLSTQLKVLPYSLKKYQPLISLAGIAVCLFRVPVLGSTGAVDLWRAWPGILKLLQRFQPLFPLPAIRSPVDQCVIETVRY